MTRRTTPGALLSTVTAGREADRGSSELDARLEAQERTLDTIMIRYVPYVGLAIGTALTPLIIPTGGGFWLVTGALVLVSAGWSYLFTSGRRPRAESARAGAVYIAVLLLIALALVYQSPFYGFQAFVGYAHSFFYLRGRWRWVGIGGTAVVAAYSQLGGGLAEMSFGLVLGVIALSAINGVMAGAFTYFGAMASEQSERRKHENAKLAEANRRLSETLEENAGLHAQLLTQAREAGILDERARMAREIHDTIAQGLTGVVTQLEAAGAADDEPAVRRRHVDLASALARESLSEARRSVAALTPGRLAEARLPDAIADMAKRWAETAGVELIIDTTGNPRALLPEIEVSLFRVAQEALANVGKHAQATRVGLTLSYMDDVVALDVRDDGVGFRAGPAVPAPSGGSGYGLPGMEQRVRRVAGTLVVESEPGEGTALSVSVPAIPAEAESGGTDA
jgi:signal transduction histidine kinase